MGSSTESVLAQGQGGKFGSYQKGAGMDSMIQPKDPPREASRRQVGVSVFTSSISDSYEWFIRECPPINEDVAECKARLARIVQKQKECYGTSDFMPLSGLGKCEL